MALTFGEWRTLLENYVRPHRRLMGWLALALFASIVLQVATPQVIRVFIDRATSASDEPLVWLTVLYMVAVIVQQVAQVFTAWLSEIVGWEATNELRADLMAHCLDLDPVFFEEHPPGVLIERIDGDVNGLSMFFAQFVLAVVGNVLLVVGVLAVVVIRSPSAGVWLVVFTVVALAALLSVRRISAPLWQQTREDSAELFGFIEERLSATEDLRSSAAEAHTMRGFYGRARDLIRSVTRARIRDSAVWTTNAAVTTLGQATAFLVPVYAVRSGSMSLGEAFTIYFYAQLLLQPLSNVSQQVEQVQQAIAGGRRVVQLLAIEPTVSDGEGAVIPQSPPRIELDSVSFAYRVGEPVLHDVSLDIAAGTVVGVVGRTGAGKSTLARLLTRQYDPDQGALRIGGVDVRDMKRQYLRSQVALVTQDVHVLAATVRDNITLFDPQVSDQRIGDAIETLGLGPWLASLSHGLDTVIEQGGAGMSAGEAQLLALGRTFLADPSVVVLDEASSRLDPATEHSLEVALHGLLADRTGVIIAHRLSTLDRCDSICVLDGGRVVEYGRRDLLAEKPGSHYAALVRAGTDLLPT